MAAEWTRSANRFEAEWNRCQLAVLQSLAHGRSMLDVGCNDGTISAELASLFRKVTLVEASGVLALQARQRLPQADIHNCWFEDFKTGKRFNTIYLINILEHVEDPRLVLTKARGMLAAGGRVVVSVPNAMSLNRLLGTYMGLIADVFALTKRDIEVGHKRFYTAAGLRQELELAGLKVIKSGGVMLKPLSLLQMEKAVVGMSDEEISRLCQGLVKLGQVYKDIASPLWAVGEACRR